MSDDGTPARTDGSDAYVLGHSDAELRRLTRQSEVKNPMTRRFALEAGVGPGMRVLDVGSGAGDVALLLADIVGADGQVVGFDRSATAMEYARAKAAARSVANVSFVAGGVADLPDGEPFDAAAGLPAPQLRRDGLIAAGPYAHDLLERYTGVIRTLAPAMADLGIASAAELDIDTLLDRMAGEAAETGSVLLAHTEVGAWAHRPD